ncbi:hypothetical protein [Breoghania sp.]|uniref:hypothetical protein n=1 Tax=Breoghania sp. TaxID=2065378 RepID=UPI002AA79B1F|nr:hypothetical protein [Breoghania sp.]
MQIPKSFEPLAIYEIKLKRPVVVGGAKLLPMQKRIRVKGKVAAEIVDDLTSASKVL